MKKKSTHNPVKITIVSSYFYPKIGGVETYAYTIGKHLHNSKKYKISIITSNYNKKGYQKEIVEGMTIHRLPVWFKISNTPINPLWYWWVKRILKSEKTDIIHTHSPVPFLADVAVKAAEDSNIRIVTTYHSGSMKKDHFLIDFLIDFYESYFLRKLFKRADAIIAISFDFVKNKFPEYLYKTSFIPTGVDLKRFIKTPLPTDTEVISFIGRIEHTSSWKGIDQLIMAMAIVLKNRPNVKLELVGGGDAIEFYKKQAEELNISKSLIIVGPQYGQDLVDCYRRATIVALPSTSDAEAFSIVLVEAMASGRVIIGTNIGGTPQVINSDVDGLLITPKDPIALAEAIEKLFDKPELTKSLIENAFIKVQKFDWSIQVEKYEKIFNFILDTKPTIIQVCGYYPPHLGGMEKVTQALSENLAKDDYRVQVLTSNIDQPKKDPSFQNLNLRIKKFKAFEFAHIPFAAGFFFELFRIQKRSIIHLHLAQAYYPELVLMISKLRKIPYIVHFHLDIMPLGFFGKIFLIYKKYITTAVIKNASKIIVFSKDQQNLIVDKYAIPLERISIIPNGVGAEFFIDHEKLNRHQPLQLLYVGRVSIQKRIERLIDAMALIKTPCHLTIVGEGEERAKIEAHIKMLGLKNVSFVGKKYGNDLLEYYKNCDVFVVSSDQEGMPLSVLEAMAAGLPIVATNVIGLRELVLDTGILVDEHYATHFAEAFDALSQDIELFKKLSLQSIEKAKQYTWTRLVNELETIYQKISP